MSDTETYVVVYQFGKVASTSLVASLNQLPGVEAVQSHFLGADALHKIVRIMMSPQTSDYFFEHEIKQFEHNMRVTRRMQAIRLGNGDQRLVIVTLTRDPMEWFRSAITQSIDGYLPAIHATAEHAGFRGSNPDARVITGVRAMLGMLARSISALGGIEATLTQMHERKLDLTALDTLPQIPGLNVLFYLCMRPFDWFDSHFEVATATALEKLSRGDGFWHGKRHHTDMVVFRYEDLNEVLPRAMRHAGLADNIVLKKKNLSRRKPFDAAMRAAFRDDIVAPLAAHFDASRYSRFFGYTAPAETVTAGAPVP